MIYSAIICDGKHNQCDKFKSSCAAVYLETDWLQLLFFKVLAERALERHLVLTCDWCQSSALVSSHRDVWVRAVPEGNVADQDPLSWGHRRDEGGVQGEKQRTRSVSIVWLFFLAVWCWLVFVCSWREKSWTSQPWWWNRGSRQKRSTMLCIWYSCTHSNQVIVCKHGLHFFPECCGDLKSSESTLWDTTAVKVTTLESRRQKLTQTCRIRCRKIKTSSRVLRRTQYYVKMWGFSKQQNRYFT